VRESDHPERTHLRSEAPQNLFGEPSRSDYRHQFYERYHDVRETLNRDPAIVMSTMLKLWRRWLPIDKAANILDLGCGCGEFLQLLSSLGYTNLSGVDLSEVQVKIAHRFGLDGATVANALEFLADRHDCYDLISAFNLFEHLQKAEIIQLLQLVYQALRQGGRLLVITPNGLSPFSGATRYFDFSHETSFTPQSWRQLARMTGFRAPVFEDARAFTDGINGKVRTALWKILAFTFDTMSRIETAHSRDECKVYTADMKITMTKD
jgi:cyclopropane fatty-acyl-phospholipid synthase-like methyltransferase